MDFWPKTEQISQFCPFLFKEFELLILMLKKLVPVNVKFQLCIKGS